jgi:putative ABC transport system permease protein
MREFIERHMGAEIAANNTYELQPLSRIHLHSNSDYGLGSAGSIDSIRLLMTIGLLVLLISIFNYVNMATARSTLRSREVCLRKVVGAQPTHLAARYLIERTLHGLVATIAAFGLAALLLPWMSDLVQRNLTLGAGNPVQLVVGPLVGTIASLYPAIILARLLPAHILRGGTHGTTASVLVRRGLVVLQLVVTTGLLASAIVVYQQLDYVQRRDVGYDSDSLLTLGVFQGDLMDRYKVVKQAFLEHPNILQAAACWPHPAGWVEHHIVHPEGKEGESWRMQVQGIDEDFLETFGIDIVQGRDIHEDGRTPRQTTSAFDAEEYLLNEAAVRALGWKDPIGKRFRWNQRIGTVVGVVADFHSQSMHKPIEPVFLCRWIYLTLALRISTDDIPGTIQFLEETWSKFVPNLPIDYRFMDDRLAGMYRNEVLLGRLVSLFCGLAVLIAAIGLVGLAAFTTARRRKEIGVRKVLTASIGQILALLVWDTCRLVLIANVITWPVVGWLMTDWLQTFAYRIKLGLLPFALAAILSVIIACGSVGVAAFRAATMNPVEALRSE